MRRQIFSSMAGATALVLAPITALAWSETASARLSGTVSEASVLSVQEGSGQILAGGVLALEGLSELAVTSVTVAGEGAVVVLEGLSSAGRVSVSVAVDAAAALGIAAGDVIRLAATTSGTLLVAAGEVLAFVPDAAGRHLMHRRRLAP